MPSLQKSAEPLSANGKLWVLASLLLPLFLFAINNFKIVLDNQPIRCLPERMYLINSFAKPHKLDYVFFSAEVLRRASDVNHYLGAHDKIIKTIVGEPGDHLLINHRGIWINDVLISDDLTDAQLLYKKDEANFYKDEVIPTDSYFVIGTTLHSNDSRYWGYLPSRDVIGKAVGLI